MSRAPAAVSPPIAAAPINALFLGIFIGFTMLTLAVDASGDATLQRAFYAVKSGGPRWFSGFNGLMALIGLLSNAANVVFIVTRSSPRARKAADAVQALLFVAVVAYSVTRVLPAEKALSDDTASHHLVILALQLAQLVTAFVAFAQQQAHNAARKRQ